jgi:hypothetical protein
MKNENEKIIEIPNQIKLLHDKDFGRLLLAYIAVNNTDTGWEGYSTEDLKGVRFLLEDFALAVEAGFQG